MNNPAFIFDDVCLIPDRQIGMHSHARWELSYVVCGAGMRTIGTLSEPFSCDEIVLIPPSIPHVWRFDESVTDASGNIANISVFFDASVIASMVTLFPEMAEPLGKLLSLDRAMAFTGEPFRTVRDLLLSMRGATPENRFPKMMELLIAISDTSAGTCAGLNNAMTRAEQRLEKVRVYCACNYASPITLDELSRHVGMNKSAFCNFMRHSAGMTLSEYVNNMRLDRAREKLLHSDLSIGEIATDCGFRNVTYFDRLFRARFGCTPRSIRRTELCDLIC